MMLMKVLNPIGVERRRRRRLKRRVYQNKVSNIVAISRVTVFYEGLHILYRALILCGI